MRQTIDRIFRYIAPYQCFACGTDGALLCKACLQLMPEAESVCYKCGRETTNYFTCTSCAKSGLPNAVYCGTDYEFAGKQLVHNLKFDHSYEAARLIAIHLSRLLCDIPKSTVIVPLPTAPRRVRERGFDQSVLIAKELSRIMRLPYSNILIRDNNIRQTSLSRQERLNSVGQIFRYKTKHIKIIKSVLLVDDVMSTGSTIESASILCKQNGVEDINAVVFATNRKL